MKKRQETTKMKIVNSNTGKVVVDVKVDSDTGEILENIAADAKPKSKTYSFKLVELRMKNTRWEMHALISGTMSQIYKNYRLTLVVNLDKMNEKIELCMGRMQKAQLRVTGGSDAHDEYNALLSAKEELIENCPDIQLEASVVQSKYPVGDTFIVFHISPEIINKLNDHRNYMEHYDLKMEPLTFA